MLFDDITTPEERSLGYLPAKVILKRCLASQRYRNDPLGHGGQVYVASVGIGRGKFELSFDFDPKDSEETDIFWHYPSGKPHTSSVKALVGYVPLTPRALVATLSATFGLCPDMVAHTAVNLEAYWAGEDLDDTDFSLPPPKLVRKYRLLA